MNNLILQFVFAFACLFFFSESLRAQPGNFDLTYNGTGRVFYGVQNGTIMSLASALQADGKLVLAGYEELPFSANSNYALWRFNENGSPDNSFGQAGKMVLDLGNQMEQVTAVAIQPDGKILAGGSRRTLPNYTHAGVLIRVNANGTPDNSFGTAGIQEIDWSVSGLENELVSFIKIISSGDFIVSGNKESNGLLAKFLTSGTKDLGFGNAGIISIPGYQAGGYFHSSNFDIQVDGKIVAAGFQEVNGTRNFYVGRFLANGSPDVSFNGTGFRNTYIGSMGAEARLVKVLADGGIMVGGVVRRVHGYLGGYQGADFALVRYLSSGTEDPGFGAAGIVTTSFDEEDAPVGIGVQQDGKIIVSGNCFYVSNQGGRHCIARYLANGSLDNSFATGGKRIYTVDGFEGSNRGMWLSANRIYLTGWANNNQITGYNIFAIQNDGSPFANNQVDLCPPVGNTSIHAGIAAASYQWQLSTDSVNFSNLGNNANYSNVNSQQLGIQNIPSSAFGNVYRCVTPSGNSTLFYLRFTNSWTGAINNNWENPGNWSCGVLPDLNTLVFVNSGSVIVNSNVTVRSLVVGAGASINIAAGYQLTVTH